jgi:hypothetical protein
VANTSTTRKEDPKRSKNTSRERVPKIHEKGSKTREEEGPPLCLSPSPCEKKRSRKTPSHVETPLCQTHPPHTKKIQKDPENTSRERGPRDTRKDPEKTAAEKRSRCVDPPPSPEEDPK